MPRLTATLGPLRRPVNQPPELGAVALGEVLEEGVPAPVVRGPLLPELRCAAQRSRIHAAPLVPATLPADPSDPSDPFLLLMPTRQFLSCYMNSGISWVRTAGNGGFLKGQHSVNPGPFLLCEAQPAPDSGAPGAAAAPLEAALSEALAVLPLCLGALSGLGAPPLVAGVEVLGVVPKIRLLLLAALSEESGQDIHLRPVLPCRPAYLVRCLEAFALPLEAPLHDPGEDPGSSWRSVAGSFLSCSAGGI